MKKAPPLPFRPNYIEKIRDMPVGAYLYFKGSNPNTIKTIASRVGKTSKPRRKYTTQKENGGVNCWRET